MVGEGRALGEWTWGHCWVPLQGANFCFISSSYIQGHQFQADAQENNNEFCLELLADATLFSTLITQKLVFAIWGLCWYNFFSSNQVFGPVDCKIFPQIAIAIGVLTSNRGGGRRTTLADWTWHQGAIAGCRGCGAIAGCFRGVPL